MPSVSLTAHVQADSVQIKASMGILRDALGGTLLPGDEEVSCDSLSVMLVPGKLPVIAQVVHAACVYW